MWRSDICHRQISDFRFPIVEWKTSWLVPPRIFSTELKHSPCAFCTCFARCPILAKDAFWVSNCFGAATSVAANYRSACRARSRPDFLNKLGVVEEEADESLFWLEFIVEAGLIPEVKLRYLVSEASQLTAIFVASRRTAKRNNRKLEIEDRKSS